MAEDPRIAQAAQSLGPLVQDVIASAITETDVVFVLRQGWKWRIPLSTLVSTVSAETPVSEEPREEAVPVASSEQSEEVPDEPEPVRPRRRRGA
jgi:hypothetical protein